MKATTLWVVFTLFIVIYQASALPLAPHKEAEDVKSADVPKQEDKDIKEDEKEQGSDNKDEEEEESSADEEEQPDEEVDSESNGSASADKPEESEEKERRSVEESGESPKGASDKKSKAVAVSGKAHRRCGCGQCGGGSWGVCDLCHHPHGQGWCGAGCQCANCCGGFGHPVTNHGCNGGCCPSVTFPCSFGACVNNPCCECCREPAPPGKCKWPCLWPCCCECTPPKFKFKPLKPKPVCHCPHTGCCGHKRSDIPSNKRQLLAPLAPIAPAYAPIVHPYAPIAHPYAPIAHPYAYAPHALVPVAPPPYAVAPVPYGYGPPLAYGPTYHY